MIGSDVEQCMICMVWLIVHLLRPDTLYDVLAINTVPGLFKTREWVQGRDSVADIALKRQYLSQ